MGSEIRKMAAAANVQRITISLHAGAEIAAAREASNVSRGSVSRGGSAPKTASEGCKPPIIILKASAGNLSDRGTEFTKFPLWARPYQCVFCKIPCTIGSQADIAILVLWEVSTNTVLTNTTFPSRSEADSREEFAGASLCSGTLSSTRFSVNCSYHSGKSRNRSLRADSVSSFLSVFSVSVGSSERSLCAHLLVLSLRAFAGRNVQTTESCNNDAGDVCVVDCAGRAGR